MKYFESEISINQNLSFEYANNYFEKKNTSLNKENKKTLGLINKEGLYTNLGLIISDQSPYVVKIATYQNETALEFKTRKDFEGSIFKIIEDVLDYFNIINLMKSNIVLYTRYDRYDYPHYALREAFFNALMHRDYIYKGGIIINVYVDRIEMISLGGIIGGLTLEDIKRGISETRNPKLANVFYRLDLIEAYGTGVRRINESYADFFRKPEIIATQNTFTIILYNINYNKVTNKTDKQKIIDFIKSNNSITRLEVEKLLNVKKTTALNIINEMIKDKIIYLNEETKRARYYLKEN